MGHIGRMLQMGTLPPPCLILGGDLAEDSGQFVGCIRRRLSGDESHLRLDEIGNDREGDLGFRLGEQAREGSDGVGEYGTGLAQQARVQQRCFGRRRLFGFGDSDNGHFLSGEESTADKRRWALAVSGKNSQNTGD